MSFLRKITKETVTLFTHTHKIKSYTSYNEELLLKMEKKKKKVTSTHIRITIK